MTPEDLGLYSVPSDPQLHPDGNRVAFVVTRMDLDEDRYDKKIWLWDGSESRAFTGGPGDTMPRWSPDGSSLAFLRAEPDAKPQLAVMAANGGEARVVTDFPLGVTALAWSPDGSKLAVVATTWVGPWADLEEDERTRRPRRFTHLSYRHDVHGWLHDRRRHIYVIDARDHDAEPRQLTDDAEFSESAIAWHPGGEKLAFTSGRHAERHVDGAEAIWEVDATGGEPKQLAAPGSWAHLTYRPDGDLFAVGLPDVWAYPAPAGVYRVDAAGLTNVAPDLDRSFYSLAPSIDPIGPQWTRDGFVAVVEHEGGSQVLLFRDGEPPTTLAGGPRAISGAAVREDGSAMAMTVSTPTDPGELIWWEGAEERVLTPLNARFRGSGGLVAPDHFSFESDGHHIEAWVYLPPGDADVPLLLSIHGGPASQYGWNFFDEFQVYAGAGYGVVACNPRGSAGYGTEFMRAVVGVWGEQRSDDLLDIVAAADEARRRHPRLDAERMGIMGGSYGGFATTRILSFDHRFRSAVVERALTAMTSFSGTSDIGPRFPLLYLGKRAPDDWEELWQASPLATADQITTPTLVLHSDSDWRTPIEQGEQLFTVLSLRGVETEMVRFPDEGHELSRSGKPKHRLDRFRIILDWHQRHIGSRSLAT